MIKVTHAWHYWLNMQTVYIAFRVQWYDLLIFESVFSFLFVLIVASQEYDKWFLLIVLSVDPVYTQCELYDIRDNFYCRITTNEYKYHDIDDYMIIPIWSQKSELFQGKLDIYYFLVFFSFWNNHIISIYKLHILYLLKKQKETFVKNYKILLILCMFKINDSYYNSLSYCINYPNYRTLYMVKRWVTYRLYMANIPVFHAMV